MRIPERQLWRETTPVMVDAQTARSAQQQIASCESCTPDAADIPLDDLLDSITGCDPESTDYVLADTAQCPACGCRTSYRLLAVVRIRRRGPERVYPACYSDRFEARLVRTRNLRFTAATTLLLQFMRLAISPSRHVRITEKGDDFLKLVARKVRFLACIRPFQNRSNVTENRTLTGFRFESRSSNSRYTQNRNFRFASRGNSTMYSWKSCTEFLFGSTWSIRATWP